jgi:hypothetical protein
MPMGPPVSAMTESSIIKKPDAFTGLNKSSTTVDHTKLDEALLAFAHYRRVESFTKAHHGLIKLQPNERDRVETAFRDLKESADANQNEEVLKLLDTIETHHVYLADCIAGLAIRLAKNKA